MSKVQTFHAEEVAVGKHLAVCKAVRATGEADRVNFLRREGAHHVQRLFHVQGAQVAVLVAAVVIVNAVGQVAVLLNFGNQNSAADGVQKPCAE